MVNNDHRNEKRDEWPGQLELRAREVFDEHVASLDAHARSRLNQARQAALDTARNKQRVITPRWLVPAGSMAAVAMIASITFQYLHGGATGADKPAVTSAMEDMEIIASKDDLDLLQNVDFYEWMDTADAADGEAG